METKNYLEGRRTFGWEAAQIAGLVQLYKH
jgi:hypothetical protein